MPDWFIKTWQAVGEARAALGERYKSAAIPILGPTHCC
jgi:hypothetical protein